MKHKAFSIRDSKGMCYLTPFFKKSLGEAERDFMTLVNDERSMVAKYPDDYDLWYLGEFDDDLGTLASLQTPQHVAKAISLVRGNNVQEMKHKNAN